MALPDLSVLAKLTWQFNIAITGVALLIVALIYNEKYISIGIVTFAFGVVSHFFISWLDFVVRCDLSNVKRYLLFYFVPQAILIVCWLLLLLILAMNSYNVSLRMPSGSSTREILYTALGGIVGFVFAIVFEKLRVPSLVMTVGSKTVPQYLPTKTNIKYSFLHILVQNKNEFFGLTNTAFGVKATIEFVDSNNKRLIPIIDGRWSGNPEPIITTRNGPVPEFIYNPPSLPLLRKIDIPAGNEGEELDVVIKYDDDESIYAFSNESYSCEHWCNNEWRMSAKDIFINVIVLFGSVKKSKTFKLENPGSIDGARLIELSGK